MYLIPTTEDFCGVLLARSIPGFAVASTTVFSSPVYWGHVSSFRHVQMDAECRIERPEKIINSYELFHNRPIFTGMKLKCEICGNELNGRQRRFCSIKCKNGKHQLYSWQHDRGMKYRNELISLAGGKCVICGYNKNTSVLHFHHIDPTTKLFQLDVRSCSNRSKEKCLVEMRKCKLVCSNCHGEIHNPHS